MCARSYNNVKHNILVLGIAFTHSRYDRALFGIFWRYKGQIRLAYKVLAESPRVRVHVVRPHAGVIWQQCIVFALLHP